MRTKQHLAAVVLLMGFMSSCTQSAAPADGRSDTKPASRPPSGTIVTDPNAGQEQPAEDPVALTSMNEKIPLRPAMMMGTLAVGLVQATDLERFTEEKYVWNPAQVPLTQLNKLVCVLSRTGFHLYPDQGRYTAKMLLDECFASQTGGANPDQSTVKKPVDVIVETARAMSGAIGVKVWFTRERTGGGHASAANSDDNVTWESYQSLEMNYFVQATIDEIPNNDNPFGVLDMRWEMLVKIDGEADSKPYQQGYVTTEKNATNDQKVQLTYNQRNWNYQDRECPDRSYAMHQGFVFKGASEGSGLNGITLNFDGASTIGSRFNPLTESNEDDVTVEVTDDAVFPAGSVTFSGAHGILYASASPTIEGNAFVITSTATSDQTVMYDPGDTMTQVLLDNSWLGMTVTSGDVNYAFTSHGSFQLTGGAWNQSASGVFTPSGGSPISGLTFSIDMVYDPASNGKILTFDGTKTMAQALAAFKEDTGYTAHIQNTSGLRDLVLPAGSVTLNGGVARVAATGQYVKPSDPTKYVTFTSGVWQGLKLNGFKLTFDGVKTINDVMNGLTTALGPTAPRPQIDYGNTTMDASNEVLPAGTVVELTGGAGPPSDIYATIREFAATAEMNLLTGKPVNGRAHTAENWIMEKVSGSCPTQPSWNPAPISYGLAFNRFDTYPERTEPTDEASRVEFPGRAAVKQFSEYVATGAAAGYDPTQLRCEQMGGELANVWQWAIFDQNGNKIEHRTNFPLFIEGSTNQWGDGWVSPWGISIWGTTVTNGQRAYIKNSDGSPRYFTIERYNGVLRDSMWMNVMLDQDSGTQKFTCATMCPFGTLDQTILSNAWDPAHFLMDQEYVFNYAEKKLYRYVDTDADNVVDADDDYTLVTLASGAEGSFELNLTLGSDNYRYSMSSWSNDVGLLEGSTYFVPPKKIVFDISRVYTADDAYPGSATINASHNGQALSDLISGDSLVYEYGNLCCFNWEQKPGIKDQWGNNAYAATVTLKKGTVLTVDTTDGDPDGATGPLYNGMPIKVAPQFSELRPVTKNDCSSALESEVAAIESGMTLPAPLANAADRRVSDIIGARPSGVFPLLIQDGEKMQ